MVVDIGPVVPNVTGLLVDVTITGLTPGTRYDVMRLHLRDVGEEPATGVPRYERELPDDKRLWSSVAHRVAWVAPTATVNFMDYEAPTRPYSYFVVPTDAIGPFEWDFALGDYPVTNGVLDSQVVHLDRDLQQLIDVGDLPEGGILVRSTDELGLWAAACVQSVGDIKYTARGTEYPVMGRQYPVYVADTRQARRGTLTVVTDTLGEYDDFRRIVFPQDGTIRPVMFNAGGEDALLLDDMRIVPLDVTVQQADPELPYARFISIDYIEVDPTQPLVFRTGDNDSLVNAPKAAITITPAGPYRINRTITFTDSSTGQYEKWDWSFFRRTSRGSNVVFGKRYTQGPQALVFRTPGTYTIKLRVYGNQGASVVTRVVTVR